jgi:TolB-like protein/Tfp pilus assembly protein PilF/tRNA A-37 threonylcarbamoyl transferase component Bud32
MVEQDALELVREPLADRYAIERVLGQGGTAIVYLATEVKHGRPVAVKVLHPEFTSAVGGDRFLREIRIAARLSHPHLVPLIDSGEAGGWLFSVSAFIDGGSLRDRLREVGRLSVADAVRVVREAGAGLDFAHRAGIVHRDVKPENILFADGLALLADFGIARATCADVSELVTAAGLAVGTPEYMSPEQALGEQELDARSDIYSLACVLFEALTGEPPFRGASSRATVGKHLTETPRRVRVLRADVPAEIDDAIARALSKDREHRWSGVPDFLAALEVRSAPRGHAYARAARRIAVLPFVNASPDPENEYLSDGITDELIDALAKVEGIRVASRTSVFALKGKAQDVRAIGALLDCAVVLEGTVRRAGAKVRITAQLTSTADGSLVWSQRYERQLDDVLEIQDEIARTIVNTLLAKQLAGPAVPPARRHTANARAHRLYLQGRYEWTRRTKAGVAAGIQFFEEAIAEDPSYALAWTGLADCYALEVDYRSIPVDEGFAKAKEYARRAIALDETLSEAHASLAWSNFVYDWDWAAAEREFRRAIDLDPRNATAHQWYAFLLHSRGQLGEGLVEGHTAVELEGGNVSARRSLAWGYYYARRYEQSRFHLERAIAMDPNAEETYRVLGHTLAIEGAHADAVAVLEDAVVMPGSGSYTRATMGYAYALAGRRHDATRILHELEAEAAVAYVSPVALATLHLGLGHVESALDWTERALEARRGWLVYLRVNPILDPLRTHPRFERLVERMKL